MIERERGILQQIVARVYIYSCRINLYVSMDNIVKYVKSRVPNMADGSGGADQTPYSNLEDSVSVNNRTLTNSTNGDSTLNDSKKDDDSGIYIDILNKKFPFE